jgi:hypothetical protein
VPNRFLGPFFQAQPINARSGEGNGAIRRKYEDNITYRCASITAFVHITLPLEQIAEIIFAFAGASGAA